jgi:Tol biopolymer transport system component
MNPDGTGRRKLVDLGHRSAGGLAWSPDGSTLAFGASTPDGSSNQIYVMDADGSRLRTLTEPDLNATGNWWSPDGSRIAFFTGGYLALHLTTMASDGSDMRVVDGFPALPEVVVGEGIAWNPVG